MNKSVKRSKTERPAGFRVVWCTVWLMGALAGLFLAPAADGVGKKDRVHAFGNNPAFELLNEEDGLIRFSFKPGRDGTLDVAMHQLFLAVPMVGDITVSIERWSFQDTVRKAEIVGSVADFPDERQARVQEALKAVIKNSSPPAFMGFHDVRVLTLTLKNKGRILEPVLEPPVMIEVNELIVLVQWKTEGKEPSEKSTEGLTDAFDSLFESVILNHNEVDRYRARPPLADARPKQMDPAWLKALGHSAEGSLLHGADTVYTPRDNAIRLHTEKRGLYRYSAEEMQLDGIDPASVDVSGIEMWRDGKRIPHWVYGGEDGRLDTVDGVVFYAEMPNSAYSRFVGTWMTWSLESGSESLLRTPPSVGVSGDIPSLSSTEVIQRWEENKRLAKIRAGGYSWVSRISDGTGWKVSPFARGESSSVLPITWPGRAEESPLDFRAMIWNRWSKAAELSMHHGNNTQMHEVNQRADNIVALHVPADRISENGVFDLRVSHKSANQMPEIMKNPKAGDEKRLFLDWVEVKYRRRLDTSHGPFRFQLPKEMESARLKIDGMEAGEPVVLWEVTGVGNIVDWSSELSPASGLEREVLVRPVDDESWFELARLTDIPHTEQSWRDTPSTLLREENQADIVMIAYSSLVDEARPLAEYHNRRDGKTSLVDVQDIYDEFNGGTPSLDAIKTFLKYTQVSWRRPAPQVVILIGDASWDHRDSEETFIVDQIPIYAPPSDPQAIASDEWLADLWGNRSGDKLPDLIVGRISVREPEELHTYVEKVIEYETEPEMGWWRTRNLFVSDDTFQPNSREVTRESTPLFIEPTYVDQVDYPYQTNPYLIHVYKKESKFSPECTQAIVRAFNRGSAVLQYFGHGGAQLWSDERIFLGTDRDVSDVLLLNDVRRLPFIVNWSCLTGLMNLNMKPFNVCLAEELIRHPRRGAIAVWAPHEYGSTDKHKVLAHHLMQSIGASDTRRLGTLTSIARVAFTFIRHDRELVDQYVLFGDPLLKLAVPTKRIRLTAEPTELFIDPQTGTCQTEAIVVTGNVTGLESARVSVRVYDREQRQLLQSEEMALDRQGEFRVTLPIADMDLGTEAILLRAYAYDAKARQDASGGMRVPVGTPDLAVESVEVQPEGAKLEVSATIANVGSFSSRPTAVVVRYADQTLPQQQLDTLPPRASVVVKWSLDRPKTLEYIVVEVDPSGATTDVDRENNANSALAQPATVDPVAVPAANEKQMLDIDRASVTIDQKVKVRAMIAPLTERPTTVVVAQLIADGVVMPTRSVFIRQEDAKRIEWAWTPNRTGPVELLLRLTDADEKTERTLENSILVQERPDLYIVENSLRATPKFPIVGHTCYLTLQVGNRGETAVRSVAVLGTYKTEGTEEVKKVRSFSNKTYVRAKPVKDIAAGEIRDVTLQWDEPGLPAIQPRHITVTIDDTNIVKEADELNNSATTTVNFQGLPDLAIDLWSDHSFKTSSRFHRWGEPLNLWGRVRNLGGGPAEHARISFLHNREEHPVHYPMIRSARKKETSVAIPIYSGYNIFELEADRFDMMSEKDEKAYRTGQKGNNISKPIRLPLTMLMPPGEKKDDLVIHDIRNETQFAAGIAPLMRFRKGKGITLNGDLGSYFRELQPGNVVNATMWTLDRRVRRWWQDTGYSCFRPPEGEVDYPDIEFNIYSPNGNYDLSLATYVFTDSASASIKVAGQDRFQVIEAKESAVERITIPIGPVTVTDGSLRLTARAVEGDMGLYSVSLKSNDEDQPHGATYSSALFPVPGDWALKVEVAWEGQLFERSRIRMKARLWSGRGDDRKPGKWSEIVEGESGSLKLNGWGDYVQFQAELVQDDREATPPFLRRVVIQARP